MNPLLARKIKRKLQRELIKRQLNEFFVTRGYDNFSEPLYPPIAATLPQSIPHLISKCEVVPYAESVDVATGIHKIGWNLFVLGNYRLDLGSTSHTSATEILRATQGKADTNLPAEMKTTPDRVIEFILKVLDNSKSGYIDLPQDFQLPINATMQDPILGNDGKSPRLAPTSSGAFYSGPR